MDRDNRRRDVSLSTKIITQLKHFPVRSAKQGREAKSVRNHPYQWSYQRLLRSLEFIFEAVITAYFAADSSVVAGAGDATSLRIEIGIAAGLRAKEPADS
jgi:hypothetical protein